MHSFPKLLLVGLMSRVFGFSIPSKRSLTVQLRASEADCEALASRLSDEDSVRNLFVIDGEELPFLRRKEFCSLLSQAEGMGTPSDESLLEFWMYFGGAPPPAQRKKPQANKGFLGNFAATIADNAKGSIDPRPKDEWGNPKKEQTLITPAIILGSDLAESGFTEAAYKEALLSSSS